MFSSGPEYPLLQSLRNRVASPPPKGWLQYIVHVELCTMNMTAAADTDYCVVQVRFAGLAHLAVGLELWLADIPDVSLEDVDLHVRTRYVQLQGAELVFRGGAGPAGPVLNQDTQLRAFLRDAFARRHASAARSEPLPEVVVRVDLAEGSAPRPDAHHCRVTCDVCGSKEFDGERFYCRTCDGGFDMCGGCAASDPHAHDSSHDLLLVPTPLWCMCTTVCCFGEKWDQDGFAGFLAINPEKLFRVDPENHGYPSPMMMDLDD
jgi:hypothetical protein